MWKILVVDDVFANRLLLLDMLRDVAHCDAAANGEEAIEAYNLSVRSKPYDVILVDIAMPGMSGIEFLELVRENEKKAGIALGEGVPIILVTAYKDKCIEGFNRGCDDYVLKPVDAEELLKKIENKVGNPK